MPAFRSAAVLTCVLTCTLALGACNQTRSPSSALPPAASAGAPPSAAQASAGGCSGAIARFRTVVDSDGQTGNVNASVYKRLTGEVDRAAATCAAGRDGEALRQLAGTRARFGYPAG